MVESIAHDRRRTASLLLAAGGSTASAAKAIIVVSASAASDACYLVFSGEKPKQVISADHPVISCA